MSRVNDLLLRLHSRRIVRRTASVTEANVQGWDFAMMDLFVGTTSHLHNSTSIAPHRYTSDLMLRNTLREPHTQHELYG